MKSTGLLVAALVLAATLAGAGFFAAFPTAAHATAQAPAQPQGAPAGQQQPPPPKQNIDVATAKKMVAAAEAAATAANAHVAISIVDANGDLVYFERMDGAAPRAVTSSQGKARAALLFGVPTKEAKDAMDAGKPLPTILTAPAAGAWELTIQQGGLPILKDGKVIAAIGCGGSASSNDEKFAQAGIDAMSSK
jgi:glc operon protein GlcG